MLGGEREGGRAAVEEGEGEMEKGCGGRGGGCVCMCMGRMRRTVAPGSCLVVEMVAHHRSGLVQQVRGLGLTLAFEGLLQQVDVVPPTGLDEDLAHGSALSLQVSRCSVSSVAPWSGLGCPQEFLTSCSSS